MTTGPTAADWRERKRQEIADWKEAEVEIVEVLSGNIGEPLTECPFCRPFARKRFPIAKAPVTPFHDGCRCDTIAIVE